MGKKEYYFDKISKDEFKLMRILTLSKENPDEHI